MLIKNWKSSCILLVYCVIFLFFESTLNAEKPFVLLTGGSQEHYLNDYAEIYISDENDKSPSEVLKKQKFSPASSSNSNLGYTNKSLWAKITFVNKSPTDQKWYFGTSRHDSSHFDVYTFDENQELLQDFQMGWSVPFNKRTLPSRLHFAELVFPKKSKITVLVRIQMSTPLSLNLHLVAPQNYVSLILEESSIQFAYQCLLAFLFVFYLAVYISMQFRDALLYSYFCLSLSLTNFFYSGYIESFGLDSTGLFNSGLSRYIQELPIAVASFYAIDFLKLSEVSKSWKKACLVIGWSILFVLLVSLLPSVPLSLFNCKPLLVAFSFVILVCASIASIRKGIKEAWAFLIGWTFFGITIVVWLLANYGYLPRSRQTGYAPLVGNLAEFVILGIVLVFRLKSQQTAKQQAMTLAAVSASESEMLRTLLRIISHDVNNIITVISFSAMQIAESQNPEETKQLGEKIQRATTSLENVVAHVSRLDALRSGKVELYLQECDIVKLIEQSIDWVCQKAKEKKIDIVFECDKLLNYNVLVDPTCFVFDILNNVLSNAIKFSYPGEKIEIKTNRSGKYIEIIVKDSGIGMSEELIAKIFSSKSATSRKGTCNEKGTGFGMPILKSVLDLHKGKVEIISREKQPNGMASGTTFIISVPQKVSAHSTASIPPAV